MSEYRRGSHSVFRRHVHLVWCTKYRKRVLRGELGHRLRDLVRQSCSDLGVEVVSGVVSADHVHSLVPHPPQVSVSKLVLRVKGKSSYKLQREYQALRKKYWGPRMWARGYFACTTGNVTDDMIKTYIEGHTDTGDHFKITDFESE